MSGSKTNQTRGAQARPLGPRLGKLLRLSGVVNERKLCNRADQGKKAQSKTTKVFYMFVLDSSKNIQFQEWIGSFFARPWHTALPGSRLVRTKHKPNKTSPDPGPRPKANACFLSTSRRVYRQDVIHNDQSSGRNGCLSRRPSHLRACARTLAQALALVLMSLSRCPRPAAKTSG